MDYSLYLALGAATLVSTYFFCTIPYIKGLSTFTRRALTVVSAIALIASLSGLINLLLNGPSPTRQQAKAEIANVTHYVSSLRAPSTYASATTDVRAARRATNAVVGSSWPVTTSRHSSSPVSWDFNVIVSRYPGSSCLIFDRSTRRWHTQYAACAK